MNVGFIPGDVAAILFVSSPRQPRALLLGRPLREVDDLQRFLGDVEVNRLRMQKRNDRLLKLDKIRSFLADAREKKELSSSTWLTEKKIWRIAVNPH